jgi:hypothetical protein
MKSFSLRLVSRCASRRKAGQQEPKTKCALCATPWVRIVGWTSVATGTLAVGYFVGRNLRARYRMRRRTPYDFYSHAGDNGNGNGMEYGVGI